MDLTPAFAGFLFAERQGAILDVRPFYNALTDYFEFTLTDGRRFRFHDTTLKLPADEFLSRVEQVYTSLPVLTHE